MENYISVKSSSRQIFENECVTILFNELLSMLIIEWKRQITLSERVAAFKEGLNFSNNNKIKLWLVDAQQTFLLSQEEKTWILEEWIPLTSTSSIVKLAVVYSENYNSLMTQTDFTRKGKERYQALGSIEHEAFFDTDIATSWLIQPSFEF